MTNNLLFKRRHAMAAGAQSGLTLAEVLLVIAIGAVAIVSATMLFMTARSDQRVNDSYQGTLALASAVQDAYMGSATITASATDMTTAFANAELAPTAMIEGEGTGTLVNPWNGIVEINGATGDPSSFRIEHSDVPQSACVKLATRFGASSATQAQAANVRAVTMGSTEVTADNFPIDAVQAETECTNGLGDFMVEFGK